MARLLGMIDTRFRFRDRINARHLLVIRNAFRRLDGGGTGKPIEIAHRNQPLLNMVDVVSDEAAPPLVEDQSEAAAGVISSREITAARIEAEIEVTDRNGCAGFASRCYLTSIAAVHAVNAIVQAPPQAVEITVRDAKDEPLQHHFTDIGLAISVRVLQENDLGRSRDKHAAVPRCD